MKILVAGGRDFTSYKYLEDQLDNIHWHTPVTSLISGGAKGADTLGEVWADFNKIEKVVVKAEWDKYGKKAGWIRNNAMADLEPDLVVLFPGGRGTQMMHDIAKKRGIMILDCRNGQ